MNRFASGVIAALIAAFAGAASAANPPFGSDGSRHRGATETFRLQSIPQQRLAAVIRQAQDERSASTKATVEETTAADRQVFYHVFTRSMRDSNGDGDGDLQGLIDSLDYLQSLGITTLLLTPLYPSAFYHNYFTSDFGGIDPEFGTLADYHRLVTAVHARGMQLYLDQEIQYTDGRHPWYVGSLDNPASPYADFILYKDAGNHEPETAVFGITTIGGFGAQAERLTTVNLKSAGVRVYFDRLFAWWVDPDGDGDFSDGVDGFRIDHMMDTLDDKPRLDNLFASFWRPLMDKVRARNPHVKFIAEQWDWGYGEDFLTRGDTDFVFAFPLRGAVRSFDRDRIVQALRGTAAATPAGKHQLVFVENHDMARLASDPGMTPEKLRTAAALNLLLAGTPILYYGQELGMRGALRDHHKTDEKDIGNREGFEWSARVEAPGTPTWYRSDLDVWTQKFSRDDDGVSVQEETGDPGSLLNFYRLLIALRRDSAALGAGLQTIVDSPAGVLAIDRTGGGQRLRLVVNLRAAPLDYTDPDIAGDDLLRRAPTRDGAVALAPMQAALLPMRRAPPPTATAIRN